MTNAESIEPFQRVSKILETNIYSFFLIFACVHFASTFKWAWDLFNLKLSATFFLSWNLKSLYSICEEVEGKWQLNRQHLKRGREWKIYFDFNVNRYSYIIMQTIQNIMTWSSTFTV